MSGPPSPQQLAELQRLSGVANIVELKPLGFAANMQGSWPGTGVDVTAEVAAGLEIHRRQTGFSVVGHFSCTVHRANVSPQKPLATFTYDVTCTYATGSEEFPPELLELYARTNGMVHLWPYFRQFVQTSSAQLNLLPPIVLPAFRANAVGEEWLKGTLVMPSEDGSKPLG